MCLASCAYEHSKQANKYKNQSLRQSLQISKTKKSKKRKKGKKKMLQLKFLNACFRLLFMAPRQKWFFPERIDNVEH